MSLFCGNSTCDIQVVFIDSTTSYFEYKTHSKARDFFNTIAGSFAIYEKYYFGLQVEDKNGDLVWIDLDANLHEQVRRKTKMFFKPKFYLESPTENHYEYTLYLISLQIFNDLKSGLILTSENFEFIIACILQADLGDYDPKIFSRVDFASFVADLSPATTAGILVQYKLLKGMSPTAADSLLYEKARTIPRYSQAEFTCRDSSNNDVKLNSGDFGLSISNSKVLTFAWSLVSKIYSWRKKLVIAVKSPTLEETSTLSLYFSNASICGRAAKICNEQFKFFVQLKKNRLKDSFIAKNYSPKNICQNYDFERVRRINLIKEDSIKNGDFGPITDENSTQQLSPSVQETQGLKRSVTQLQPISEPFAFKLKHSTTTDVIKLTNKLSLNRSMSRGSPRKLHRVNSSEVPRMGEMLYEVLYSECAYIHDMECIAEEFRAEMTGIIEDQWLSQLTDPFINLISLHKPLYNSLQRDLILLNDKQSLTQSALEFFSSVARSETLYLEYFYRVIDNLQLMAGLLSNPDVQGTYDRLEKKNNVPSIRLLLQPAHQMTYYGHIIQAISNNSNENEFTEYCEIINNILQKNEENMNLALELLTLYEMHRFVETKDNIFKDPHKFIRMGVLSVSGRSELLILFNDVLLFCHPRSNSDSFDVCRHFCLSDYQFTSSHLNEFELTSEEQTVKVESLTGDLSDWLDDLKELSSVSKSPFDEDYVLNYSKMIKDRYKPRGGFTWSSMHMCWTRKVPSLSIDDIKHIFSNSFSGKLTRVLARSRREYFTVYNNSCLHFYENMTRLDECLRILCTLSCQVVSHQENGIKIRHPRVACLFVAESKYFHNRWLKVLSGTD